MTIWCKRIAYWIPKGIYTSSDTCNTSCFSTETTVMRTRPSVTLIRILPVLFYQNCRSCLSLHVRRLPHIEFLVDHNNNKTPCSSQITYCSTLNAVILSDLVLRIIYWNRMFCIRCARLQDVTVSVISSKRYYQHTVCPIRHKHYRFMIVFFFYQLYA